METTGKTDRKEAFREISKTVDRNAKFRRATSGFFQVAHQRWS